VSEINDPSRRRVSPLAWTFARAALREDRSPVAETTRLQIVERAIGLFEEGDLHSARALLYLATPNPHTAARALDALGTPPTPPSYAPLSGPAGPGQSAAHGARDALAPLADRPMAAQALLRYDGYDGRTVGLYIDIPVLWPPDLCGHAETICPYCLLDWAEDGPLALFEHGAQGAAIGCRCHICHPHDPDPHTPTPYPTPDDPTPDGPAPTPAPNDAVRNDAVPDGAAPPDAEPATRAYGQHGTDQHRADPLPPQDPTGTTRHGPHEWQPAGGEHVHVSIDTTTGLTAVSYPDRPPRHLAGGPHLAVLAAAIDAIDAATQTDPTPHGLLSPDAARYGLARDWGRR
jgi:hypothetical protein